MKHDDDNIIRASDLAAEHASQNGKLPKGRKIPYAPDRDATIPQLREWLSNAVGLPPAVRVDTVTRPGRDEDDALTIHLSNQIKIRCPKQRRLQQPRTLQALLASETDGVAQPMYLSQAEAGDIYVVLCRLATACDRVDPVADLLERLAEFVKMADAIYGTLMPDGRYATIEALRQRPAFNRNAVLAVHDGHAPTPPVLLIDQRDQQRYVRASEWVAYLRFHVGQTVDEARLPALMLELESERRDMQAWNVDRSHKTHLVFYSLPKDL